MSESSFPFANSLISTEAQWRQFFGPALGDGVVFGVSPFLVVRATGIDGLAVRLSGGQARVRGQFFSESGSEYNIPIAANSSGNPRIDRVILRNTFGSGIAVAVLQGTPAGSPVAPALTQNTAFWEISLAQVAVANGAASLAAATVTDERTFLMNYQRTLPRVKASAAGASQSLTHNTLTAIAFTAGDIYDTDGMHALNSSQVVINTAGHYAIEGWAQWASNATGIRQLSFRRTRGGSTLILPELDAKQGLSGDPTRQQVVSKHEFLGGDILELMALQQSGGGLQINDATLSASWQGQ